MSFLTIDTKKQAGVMGANTAPLYTLLAAGSFMDAIISQTEGHGWRPLRIAQKKRGLTAMVKVYGASDDLVEIKSHSVIKQKYERE